MRMEKEQIYDQYAAAALQALIAKLPLLDRDGDYADNEKMSQNELNDIKFEICKSAHAYAFMMMESRQQFISEMEEKSLI